MVLASVVLAEGSSSFSPPAWIAVIAIGGAIGYTIKYFTQQKRCVHCRSVIDKKASTCPKCGKDQ